jgi:hypothetical protein
MQKDNTIYLITSNAEAGTMETLPDTANLEVIPADHFGQNQIFFDSKDKVCITSETTLLLLSANIDANRARAIGILKNKFLFREILSEIFENYHYRLIKNTDIRDLVITEKSVIKPMKGCFGTGVRIIDQHTNFRELAEEIDAEIEKNGKVLSDLVLSKDDFIIEQFIYGEEYAVDMFYDSNGNPCIVNIYHHPMSQNPAYLHMIYYTSQEVFDKVYEKARAFFIELNKILNVTNFVMHSEFKLDDGHLFPIEINAMRYGGMGLGNMIFHAVGIDPYYYFLADREPDWKLIWQKNADRNYVFFIAYNGERKSVLEFRPDRDKLRAQFTNVLMERQFDYQKQLAFGIYCLSETKANIANLLTIEFDDYFEPV